MTGLIYVILIAIWAVVLIPRWLRHHDEGKQRRASERLRTVLTSSRSDRRSEHGVDDDRGSARAANWTEYLRSQATVNVSPWLRYLSGGPRATPAARRRRHVLLGLVALVAFSGVASVLGLLPGSLAVLAVALLTSYVAAMVFAMRRVPVLGTSSGEASVPGLQTSDAASVAAVSGIGAAVTDGVRLLVPDAGGEHSWEPAKTTLPTYVTKPKASKIPRRIDLTSSGWTGADMVAQARQQQASPELAEQFDREWAAVEPDQQVELADLASPARDGRIAYLRRAANE